MQDPVSMLGMKLDHAVRLASVSSLGEKPERETIDDRIYIKLRTAGVVFDAETTDQRIAAIFLYVEGYRGFNGFAGALPEGISFSSSRQAVQDRLGKPCAFGGGKVVQSIGHVPAWDRFGRSNYSLHVQYADNEASINLVTIMRPDSVPK